MEVVHIARIENGDYLVTYVITEDEFKVLQAKAEKESNDYDHSSG